MFTNVTPYLRASRSFPEDLHLISIEMNKAYIDIANAVSVRTIGLFTPNKPTITGEAWFYDNNQRHQGLRQIFTFITTAPITHAIDFNGVNMFSRCYGEYTDGTNWYGLISGTSVAIAGQISFYLTPTQIVFQTGAGAPGLIKGILVVEWLSNV